MIWFKIIRAIEANSVTADYALTAEFYHYAGTTSRLLGEYERAIEYYRVVVDKYPKYKQAGGVAGLIPAVYEQMEREGLISVEQAYDLVINAYQFVIDKYPNSSGFKAAQIGIERYKQDFQRKLQIELSNKMKSLPIKN